MENKFISKLVLFDELNEKMLTLNFKQGMNILIGSKGGGKSTLLKIIHLMHNKIMLNKNLLDTLREYKLRVEYLEYSNQERIYFKNLEKSIAKDFDDIITQDDKIKIALSDIGEIKKDLEAFIDNLIESNAFYLTKIISSYLNTFINIKKLRNEFNINWNLLAQFSTKNEKLTEFKHRLFENIKLEELNDNIDVKLLSLISTYISTLKNNRKDIYLKYDTTLNELASIHKHDALSSIQNKSINKIYNELLSNYKKQLKLSSDISVGVTNFKKDAKSLFNNLAIQLARNYCLFRYLNKPNFSILFKDKRKTHYDMELSIDKNILLNEISANEDADETWIFTIFDKLLYKPNKKLLEWTNWVINSYNKSDTIKNGDVRSVIIKNLSTKIKEHIQLLADGKDYNHMSLGTRTSYGIKQKINKFKEPILFLDQPEDNLDNYTIFNELIKVFNHNKQFFMVTHNSNFGTLTDPKTITTCSLNKNESYKSYIQETNILEEIFIPSEQNIKDSPVRHYLEGGNDSLYKRYQKLKKINSENKHNKFYKKENKKWN